MEAAFVVPAQAHRPRRPFQCHAVPGVQAEVQGEPAAVRRDGRDRAVLGRPPGHAVPHQKPAVQARALPARPAPQRGGRSLGGNGARGTAVRCGLRAPARGGEAPRCGAQRPAPPAARSGPSVSGPTLVPLGPPLCPRVACLTFAVLFLSRPRCDGPSCTCAHARVWMHRCARTCAGLRRMYAHTCMCTRAYACMCAHVCNTCSTKVCGCMRVSVCCAMCHMSTCVCVCVGTG